MRCKQSTTDPLVRKIFDEHDLHLLAAPNDNTAVGHVYTLADQKLRREGPIALFLPEGFSLPTVSRGLMADISAVRSGQISLEAGLSAIDGALGALATRAGLVGDLQGALAAQQVTKVEFRVTDVRRRMLQPIELKKELPKWPVPDSVPVVGNKPYFVVTGTAESASIAISAYSDSGASVVLDASKLQIASAKFGVKATTTDQNTVTFEGPKPLVFAVELLKLQLSASSRTFYEAAQQPNEPLRMTKLYLPSAPEPLRRPEAAAFVEIE